MDHHTLAFTDCYNNDASCASTSFVREENKKSSFALSTAVVLRVQSIEADEAVGDGSDGNCSTSDDKCTSSASISHCSSDQGSSDGIFLFGGFELIANVNSLQVLVTREKEEEYLTSCKGIRARDLPQLENTEQTNQIAGLNDIEWFKFVFASPGGAKPVYRVRLEFPRTANGGQKEVPCVVVRTMKIKCRLNDIEVPKPTDMAHQHAQNATQFPTMQNPAAAVGNMNNLASMMSMMQNSNTMNGNQMNAAGNTNILASMMAMMGNTNSTAAPALLQQSMQQSHSSNPMQQQKPDKNHAEMMSSIAGLGMYLRSSEEKRMRSLETMLSQMESRLSQKLDALSSRLDVIEQHISMKRDISSANSVKTNGNDNDSIEIDSNSDASQEKQSAQQLDI